jgi:hypothetical protein
MTLSLILLACSGFPLLRVTADENFWTRSSDLRRLGAGVSRTADRCMARGRATHPGGLARPGVAAAAVPQPLRLRQVEQPLLLLGPLRP